MKKKLNTFIWWGFLLFYFEILYKLFILGNIISTNTLIVLLFTIPWIVIFGTLTSIFNHKVNRVFNFVFTIGLLIIFLAQIVYFNFYNSIFSIYSLTAGTGQVMQFWEMILKVIGELWYVFLLYIVPTVLLLIFNNKLFSYDRKKLFVYIFYFIVLILSLVGIFFVAKYDKGEDNLKYLLTKTHAPMLTINKTGLMTMESIDLYRYFTNFKEDESEEEDIFVPEELTFTEPEEEKEYNMLDIDFDKLISKTSDKKVKNMHKYFKTVKPTEKNEYTGLFKDKNIIFITAEGFDAIALDEKLTPTLYMMANNGYVFKNFYQPLYTVSTSDGEYLNLTSLIPKEGVWSFSKSSKIKMSMTYGNMFKKNGYTTYGFHNHNYKYYDRHKSHPNAGFKYIGCYNGLEKKMNCKHWPNSDYEMIKATTAYYIKKPHFATYYLTVSGHLNYNFYGNNMASRNKKYVKNLKYSDAVKAYLATQIEFEKAMKELLKRLKDAGKLDDTLIVIAPDHYPYGLTKKQLNERSSTNRANKFENFHTTLIMYNPQIETQEIDKVVSSIDIMPTLYNLFGIEYDSRLIMGRDIFSDEEHIVILSDRSWITDKGTYDSVKKKFKLFKGQEVEDQNAYVKRINSIVKKRVTMSASILDNNYYKKVGL